MVEAGGFPGLDELFEAGRDGLVDGQGTIHAALGQRTDQRIERHADVGQLGRELEEFGVGAIPGNQAEVAIEDRHAVAGDIGGMLQHVAVGPQPARDGAEHPGEAAAPFTPAGRDRRHEGCRHPRRER